MTLSSDEEATVRAFFGKHRRAQFLRRAGGKNGRDREMGRLWQYDESDLLHARVIPYRDRLPDKIYRLLREKGAPNNCHVMGTSEYDGQDMDLMEALRQHLVEENSFEDVIITCIPGKLAYFHTHEPHLDDYVLEKHAPAP